MIEKVDVQASSNSIHINWTHTRFPPYDVKVTVSCSVLIGTTYVLYHYWQKYVKNKDECSVLRLRPGSDCEVTVIAIYNIANTNDLGIPRSIRTSYASKRALTIRNLYRTLFQLRSHKWSQL